MAHTHSHHHSHGHHHGHGAHGHHHGHQHHAAMNRAFILGIVLNMAFVVIQVVAGLMTHSVALLSDAGHNFSDVASLVLSLIAFRLARAKPTNSFTYGYKKTTILAALINAVVLLIAIGVLGYEAIGRLQNPQPVEGGIVAMVAGIGIVVNFSSAMLFFKNKEHDLNTKGAYLHLLTDALVSLGVVVAGLVIRYTNWYWLDGAVSVVILVVILAGTWSMLTDSLRMALDAVPQNVNREAIEQMIVTTKGVTSMHHTHIWAMSTTLNALTTHLTLDNKLSFDEKMKLVHEIKHRLHHHHIHHATIELESEELPCEDKDC